MGSVYEERIEPVATREFEAASVLRHHAQYQWFAGLALAMLLAETFVGNRREAA